jgi:hypothetical protein
MAQRLRSVAEDGPVITVERPGRRRQPVRGYPEPTWGPPVEVDEIVDETLLYSRERTACLIVADDFASAIAGALHLDGVPLDDVMPEVELLRAYVETFLVAFVTWPELCPPLPILEKEATTPTEEYAIACGLSIVPPPKKRIRTAANLPGCQWPNANHEPCRLLRRYGAKFCPDHERLVRQCMRRAG